MTVFLCERTGCDNEMRPTIHIIRIGPTLIDVCNDCNKEIEDAVTAIVKTPPANKEILPKDQEPLFDEEEIPTTYEAVVPKQ